MAEADNSLFDISVDADDYADAAAEDTPVVDRTFQSESDFLAVKAAYTARQDGGNLYSELLRNVPVLADDQAPEDDSKVKLDKRDQLLLGYVVGELWYGGEFERVRVVCERVLGRCEVEKRLRPGVERWRERAVKKLEGGGGG